MNYGRVRRYDALRLLLCQGSVDLPLSGNPIAISSSRSGIRGLAYLTQGYRVAVVMDQLGLAPMGW